MTEARWRESGFARRDPFGQIDGGAKRRGYGGKLIAMLKGMMDKYEALSLTVGAGRSYVIGKVGGDRSEWVYLWSGENKIVLNESWIERIEEQEDKVIVFGSFDGRRMLFKPYHRNQTRAMEAALTVGGDAGWLCDCIDGLFTDMKPSEEVWVTVGDWGPAPRKLQWIEYEERTGEVVLVTGRLDMLRKARLRASTLGDAVTEDNRITCEAVWHQPVTIFVDRKDLDQAADREPEDNGYDWPQSGEDGPDAAPGQECRPVRRGLAERSARYPKGKDDADGAS